MAQPIRIEHKNKTELRNESLTESNPNSQNQSRFNENLNTQNFNSSSFNPKQSKMSENQRLDLSNFLSPTIDRNYQTDTDQRYNSGYVANYQRDSPREEQSDSESGSSSGSSDAESGTASSSSESTDSPPTSTILDDTQTTKKKGTPEKFSHVPRTRTRTIKGVQTSPTSPQNQPNPHNCVQEVFAIGHLPEDHTLVRGLPQLFNVSILRELTAEDHS